MSYINKNDTRKNWTLKRLRLTLEEIEEDIKTGELNNQQVYKAKKHIRELKILIRLKKDKIDEFILDRYNALC